MPLLASVALTRLRSCDNAWALGHYGSVTNCADATQQPATLTAHTTRGAQRKSMSSES